MSGFSFDVGNTLGAIGNIGLGYFNYQLQKDMLGYQKRLQRGIWHREDTAVQRRAADLAAAGLSKTLAAGGAAGSGPVVSTTAPRMDINMSDEAVKIWQQITQKKMIEKTETEISKLRADEEKSKIEAWKAAEEAKTTAWNLDIAKYWKLPTTASKEGSQVRDFMQFLRNFTEGAGGNAIRDLEKKWNEWRATQEAMEKAKQNNPKQPRGGGGF